MEQPQSMTALVSLFARAYHARDNREPLLADTAAGQLLSAQEYQAIAANMTAGLPFFAPGFTGTEEEALRLIVNQHLAPAPLGRAVFAEQQLEQAVRLGAQQYLILAAGYDGFAYRQPAWAQPLTIFELDQPAVIQDKQTRVASGYGGAPDNLVYLPADLREADWTATLTAHPRFCSTKRSVCSLLGLLYYLPQEAFVQLLQALAQLLPPGSSLLFDYPNAQSRTATASERSQKQTALAAAAGEAMLAGYGYAELEALLAAQDFAIYEHLTPPQITARYFAAYNAAYPGEAITAPEHLNFCLAVRR